MSYWKPGHIIQHGKYVIEKVIGAGGAGVTYKAKDTVTQKIVAIKTLNAIIQTKSDFNKHQERFVQEAFRLAKSHHPHVIRVDDVCKEGELWCMVMEYIDGGNLQFLVQKKGGFSEAEAIRYISQVGNALDYIHNQGILHRDVKPANIMRRRETNEAVLIDFGLARDFVEDKTQIHTNSRTEGFAPIEQYIRNAKRGAYTDIYALAATLYFLLTVKIPFPAEFRHQGVNLIPPQQHNPHISDQVNYAILKGMELKPEDRPQSVLEWLKLLIGGQEIPLSKTSSKKPPVAKKTPPPMKPLPLPPLPRNAPTNPNRKKVASALKDNARNYDPFSPSRFVPNKVADSQPLPPTPTKNTPKIPQKSPTTRIRKTSTTAKQYLCSEVGIDYTFLEKLLAAQKWQEADQETNKLMLKAVRQEDSGWIDSHTMKTFPCQDLHILDKLWVKYSKGNFGFSVQKRIYQSLGGKREYDKKVWEATGNKLGWRVNNNWLFRDDLSYDLRASQGHLPSFANSGLLEKGICPLISRAMDCNL